MSVLDEKFAFARFNNEPAVSLFMIIACLPINSCCSRKRKDLFSELGFFNISGHSGKITHYIHAK